MAIFAFKTGNFGMIFRNVTKLLALSFWHFLVLCDAIKHTIITQRGGFGCACALSMVGLTKNYLLWDDEPDASLGRCPNPDAHFSQIMMCASSFAWWSLLSKKIMLTVPQDSWIFRSLRLRKICTLIMVDSKSLNSTCLQRTAFATKRLCLANFKEPFWKRRSFVNLVIKIRVVHSAEADLIS